MLRSEFCAAADAFIAAHPTAHWAWQEHPTAPGFGYMVRSALHARRAATEAPEDDNLDDATAAGPVETLNCMQYIVYSATFQVPAFYFTLHDASGSPLPLDELVQTTLFRRFAFAGTEKTSFAVSLPESVFPLLSQGDHPSLGTPCWYLHPCQSTAAVDEIMVEVGEQRLERWIEAWFMVLGTVVSV
ncbi:hypothetical protein B0H15DRAFT_105008 [Mycena belliarum]|uniref:Ubiquitin-like-conjugating enzyme ATG10 n=1 Tax=Mycena belliarum TaxID=1033014 RepID=A0AAD6UE77_9AGAR|nr:hypothetical protein B0H15DRAFT_105008 [Mycena belliae]